jgi:hypothetical protein
MPGQLKKLFYNKQFVDTPDGATLAQWKMSRWKVFAVTLALSVLMILIYGWLFTKNPTEFYGTIVFYAVVIVLAIVAIYIVGGKAWDFKQRITYFFIAFIIIWVFYWILSVVFSYVGLMTLYMGGQTLWVILSLLAFMGAKRIDKNIDRADIIFGGLVILVILGANIPMNSTGGFLANMDAIITRIMSLF